MTDVSANYNSYYNSFSDVSFNTTIHIGTNATFTITKDPSYGVIYADDGVTIISSSSGAQSIANNYKYKHTGEGVTSLLDDNILYDITEIVTAPDVPETASGELFFNMQQIIVQDISITDLVYGSSNNIIEISSNIISGSYDMSLQAVTDVSYGSLTISGDKFIYNHSEDIYFEDEFTFRYLDVSPSGDVVSNTSTCNIRVVEPIVYDLSFNIDYNTNIVIDPCTNFYPNNYSSLNYSFDISSSFGSIVFNDASTNFTFNHTANNINSDTFQYYVTYELLSGSVDSSSAIVSFDICGVNYPPEITEDYYYYTFLDRGDTQELISQEPNKSDGTTLMYLINYNSTPSVSTETFKAIYHLNQVNNTIRYTPIEEGVDILPLIVWRHIDGYSTDYSEALALGNITTINLQLTINLRNLHIKQPYYASFSRYSTNRLSDQLCERSNELYREYLYSTGTNSDKAEIIYNAILAIQDSLNAYKYNQESKLMYKKLVSIAMKLDGEYSPLDDLISNL